MNAKLKRMEHTNCTERVMIGSWEKSIGDYTTQRLCLEKAIVKFRESVPLIAQQPSGNNRATLLSVFSALLRWRFELLFCIHRVQHVVIKAMPPVISMFSKVEIDLCTLGKPESRALLWKRNRPVLDRLMLTEKLNFWHRTYHVGFDSYNLKLVCSDPCPTLQIHGVHLIAHSVALHPTRPIFSLAEMHQPTGLPAPVTQSFTGHGKVVQHIGMKHQSEGGKSAARDLIGITF